MFVCFFIIAYTTQTYMRSLSIYLYLSLPPILPLFVFLLCATGKEEEIEDSDGLHAHAIGGAEQRVVRVEHVRTIEGAH